MDSEILRGFLIEWLKESLSAGTRNTLQWNNCNSVVFNKIQERVPDYANQPLPVKEADAAKLKCLVWDLIIERVLIPGSTNPGVVSGDGWPIFSLTEHGKNVVTSESLTPYDPDGYLRAIQSDTPIINPTVIAYLSEEISTYRTGSFLASAVMLGAASEKLIDELCEAIPMTIANDEKRRELETKLNKGNLSTRLNVLIGWCRNNRLHLREECSGDERVGDIDRVAQLIRRRRNDAGHPTDPPKRPTRAEMYSYLVVFPEYCKHLSALKDWATSNPNSISL